MNKVDLTLDEMITTVQNRLEGLRDSRTGVMALPIENGRKLHRIYAVLSEIEDRLTPSNEEARLKFEEELTKKES